MDSATSLPIIVLIVALFPAPRGPIKNTVYGLDGKAPRIYKKNKSDYLRNKESYFE